MIITNQIYLFDTLHHMPTMEEFLQIDGENNSVICATKTPARWINNSSIKIIGNDNKILIGDSVVLNNFICHIESSGNSIEILENCRLTGRVIMKLTNGNSLRIGAGTTIGQCNIICGESTHIEIGNDCMISWGVEIRSTDSHGIFDQETNTRINDGQNITIGDHVWIGAHATLLKGSKIGSNSVVGMRSVVSDQFDEHSVIVAGIPAKIIKRGIYWDRKLLG